MTDEMLVQFKSWVADLMYEEGTCDDCARVAENLDQDNTREYAICEYHKKVRCLLAFQ